MPDKLLNVVKTGHASAHLMLVCTDVCVCVCVCVVGRKEVCPVHMVATGTINARFLLN